MPTVASTIRRIGAQARRLSGTNAAIAGVCLTAITLMWVAVIAQARFERREAVAAAIERNANLAVAFEEFSVRTAPRRLPITSSASTRGAARASTFPA